MSGDARLNEIHRDQRQFRAASFLPRSFARCKNINRLALVARAEQFETAPPEMRDALAMGSASDFQQRARIGHAWSRASILTCRDAGERHQMTPPEGRTGGSELV